MRDEGRARFTGDEERQLRDVAERGEVAICPRCNIPMTSRPIGGGSFGLGYARRREWLICGECRRSVIFDRKRGTRT